MFDIVKARELFEKKMRWVEQETGRDIKIRLMMAAGPLYADAVYEQFFACYLAGIEEGMKNSC